MSSNFDIQLRPDQAIRNLSFPCCEKDFKSFLEYKRHMMVEHIGLIPIECQLCKESFPLVEEGKAHLLKEHKSEDMRNLLEKEDRFNYGYLAGLLECSLHVANKGVTKPFLDDLKYTHPEKQSQALKPHLTDGRLRASSLTCWIRESERALSTLPHFKCSLCGEAYFSVEDMEYHALNHLGWKPFSCGLCHEEFVDVEGARHHRYRVHQRVDLEDILECVDYFKHGYIFGQVQVAAHDGSKDYPRVDVKYFHNPVEVKLVSLQKSSSEEMELHEDDVDSEDEVHLEDGDVNDDDGQYEQDGEDGEVEEEEGNDHENGGDVVMADGDEEQPDEDDAHERDDVDGEDQEHEDEMEIKDGHYYEIVWAEESVWVGKVLYQVKNRKPKADPDFKMKFFGYVRPYTVSKTDFIKETTRDAYGKKGAIRPF